MFSVYGYGNWDSVSCGVLAGGLGFLLSRKIFGVGCMVQGSVPICLMYSVALNVKRD